MSDRTLYDRLGRYEGIVAFVDEFMPRIKNDPLLSRFYQHRGEDGVARERQLLIDFLCANSGGSMDYRGRDMARAHKAMRISEDDWSSMLGHCSSAMEAVQVPSHQRDEVNSFLASLKNEIVEA